MPKALAIMINTPSSIESRASRTVRHLHTRGNPSLERILRVTKRFNDQDGQEAFSCVSLTSQQFVNGANFSEETSSESTWSSFLQSCSEYGLTCSVSFRGQRPRSPFKPSERTLRFLSFVRYILHLPSTTYHKPPVPSSPGDQHGGNGEQPARDQGIAYGAEDDQQQHEERSIGGLLPLDGCESGQLGDQCKSGVVSVLGDKARGGHHQEGVACVEHDVADAAARGV
jgi:hypothetical protein